ncbi:MAG: DUF2953 domain-containing protein [Firmicutes bacterium]|nr:DUF2953 domain-containing protein [Bacillota bacterium]
MLSLFLLFFSLLFFLLKFAVKVEAEYENLQLELALYVGLGTKFLQVPPFLLRKLEQKIRSSPAKSLSQLRRRFRFFTSVLDRLIMEISSLNLHISFGVLDPFWTALANAGLWTFVGPFVAGLESRFSEAPVIKTEPHFGGYQLRIAFRCIFRFRLGQIILNELVGIANTLST